MQCPRNSIRYFGYQSNLLCFHIAHYDFSIHVPLSYHNCTILLATQACCIKDTGCKTQGGFKNINLAFCWKKKYSWQRKSVAGFWNSNWLRREGGGGREEEEAFALTTIARLLSPESEVRGWQRRLNPRVYWTISFWRRIIQD